MRNLVSPEASSILAKHCSKDKETGQAVVGSRETHVLFPHDWLATLDEADLVEKYFGSVEQMGSFWRWQRQDNPKYYKNVFFEQANDMTKVIPLLVHGDGAQHAEHDSLFAISFRSLLTALSVKDSQFLCAGICKSSKTADTLPEIWRHLCWSFGAMAAGTHPLKDADGKPFQPGTYRHSVAGSPLTKQGFRAVVWVLAGDMEYFQNELGLPHHACNEPCAWCECNKSDIPWNDFRDRAAWRSRIRTAQQHLEDPITDHCVMEIPGVNFFSLHLDVLHVLDLGVTSHAVGNLLWELCVDSLEGNRPEALTQLNKLIVECYDKLSVPKGKRFPTLTYQHFNASANTYPVLKHLKGRRIREFVPVALLLSERFRGDGREGRDHRYAMFQSLDLLYNIIDKPQLDMSRKDHDLFSDAVNRFLLHYSVLAKLAVQAKRFRYSLVPKHHYLAHLPEQAKFLAPRASWTYPSESFMGNVAALAQSCLRGTPSWAVSQTLMLKYRMGAHLRISGLTSDPED